MSNPRVTVLISVYNGEKYLRETITSILAQTFTDFELLIVDDGSTDKTVEMIKSFADKRIVLVSNLQNMGVIRSLNKAIDLVKGEYIARMDADDIMLPARLERQVMILDSKPEVSVVASQVTLINANGEEEGYWPEDMQTKTNEDIYRVLPNDNCIANPAVMIRAGVLKKYKYNTGQKHSEDWDLWLRMAADNHIFYKINEPLVKYRIHSQSVTYSTKKKNIYAVKADVLFRYSLSRIRRFSLNRFDRRVLKNSFANCLKSLATHVHPNAVRAIKQVANRNIFKVIGQYNSLGRFCNDSRHSTSLFFFFPYYHLGGAEKVHSQILGTVKDKKPVVFITGISANNGFYEQFKADADLIDIGYIADYPFVYRQVQRKIRKFIMKSTNPVLFGCNSQFYYNLVGMLDKDVKCIDLVHAFVHKYEQGAEHWSLPVAEKLNNRVVINKKTIEDFRSLYAKHGKDAGLVSRIEYISNFTDVPTKLEKPKHDKLNVLYVGRGSEEKRVHLVGGIARRVAAGNLNAEFVLIGNVQNAINKGDEKYCKLMGEISDANRIQEEYSRADILLLTSSREGFPMVIMEAMANGVAVISTNVGGIAEHITNGKTGILVNATDENEIVNEFVNDINDLNTDRNKLNSISVNAYEYAKNNFSKEKFIDSYRKLLLT